jgi:hypothetical protein
MQPLWFAEPPKIAPQASTRVCQYPQMSLAKPSSKAFVHTRLDGIIQPMNGPDANTYPHLCYQVGLTCESCTEETGRQLARTCKGLRPSMIGQLFVQIHPHSACSRMHAHFAAAYRQAAGEETWTNPARTMAAVA